jgi:hypothetical protein
LEIEEKRDHIRARFCLTFYGYFTRIAGSEDIMRRIATIFPLLVRDERSAVRLKAATLASLVPLVIAATGLVLMSLSEDHHQERARRVLFALHVGPQVAGPSGLDHPAPSSR